MKCTDIDEWCPQIAVKVFPTGQMCVLLFKIMQIKNSSGQKVLKIMEKDIKKH